MEKEQPSELRSDLCIVGAVEGCGVIGIGFGFGIGIGFGVGHFVSIPTPIAIPDMSVSGLPRKATGLTETHDVQTEHSYSNFHKQFMNNLTLYLLKYSQAVNRVINKIDKPVSRSKPPYVELFSS